MLTCMRLGNGVQSVANGYSLWERMAPSLGQELELNVRWNVRWEMGNGNWELGTPCRRLHQVLISEAFCSRVETW